MYPINWALLFKWVKAVFRVLKYLSKLAINHMSRPLTCAIVWLNCAWSLFYDIFNELNWMLKYVLRRLYTITEFYPCTRKYRPNIVTFDILLFATCCSTTWITNICVTTMNFLNHSIVNEIMCIRLMWIFHLDANEYGNLTAKCPQLLWSCCNLRYHRYCMSACHPFTPDEIFSSK